MATAPFPPTLPHASVRRWMAPTCFLTSFLSTTPNRTPQRTPHPTSPHPIQNPLIEESSWLGSWLRGASTTSKQSAISSIDWTVSVMLFSSITSVLLYPGK